ncbi:MAG: response regulator [Gammaproteobacteria bacterium]|nr:response regulator [Gammaproteobacteria bacterium]
MHKILSVDDEPINQAIVEELFRSKFDIVLAESGEECLEKIHDINPDLILLDVSMVGLDGYETCRVLKENKSTQNIPVIFVSARGSFEDITRAYEAGGYDYILKPFNHLKLEKRIDDTIHLLKNEAIEEQAINILETSLGQPQESLKNSITIELLSATCSNISLEKLGALLVRACKDLNLDCVFQFRSAEKILHFSTKSETTPLENALFELAMNLEQQFDFNSNTIITYPHVSLLAKNISIEKTSSISDKRELLNLFLAAIESKIQSQINKTVLEHYSEEVVKLVETTLRDLDLSSDLAVEELLNSIKEGVRNLSN